MNKPDLHHILRQEHLSRWAIQHDAASGLAEGVALASAEQKSFPDR
jgi:hypothetical protein